MSSWAKFYFWAAAGLSTTSTNVSFATGEKVSMKSRPGLSKDPSSWYLVLYTHPHPMFFLPFGKGCIVQVSFASNAAINFFTHGCTPFKDFGCSMVELWLIDIRHIHDIFLVSCRQIIIGWQFRNGIRNMTYKVIEADKNSTRPIGYSEFRWIVVMLNNGVCITYMVGTLLSGCSSVWFGILSSWSWGECTQTGLGMTILWKGSTYVLLLEMGWKGNVFHENMSLEMWKVLNTRS